MLLTSATQGSGRRRTRRDSWSSSVTSPLKMDTSYVFVSGSVGRGDPSHPSGTAGLRAGEGAGVLRDVAADQRRCPRSFVRREVFDIPNTDVPELVSMINKCKINRTCHVFTDGWKVAAILFVSAELPKEIGFACLAVGISESKESFCSGWLRDAHTRRALSVKIRGEARSPLTLHKVLRSSLSISRVSGLF